MRLTLLGFLLVALAATAYGQSCSYGQVWRECACTKTCMRPYCIDDCKVGCGCPDGRPYWSEGNRTCLTDQQCFGNEQTTVPWWMTTRAWWDTPTPRPQTTGDWWWWDTTTPYPWWETTTPKMSCHQCRYGECNRYGSHCEYGCADGFYGWQCNNTCKPTCLGGCDEIDGYCLTGCEYGWDGPFCEDRCYGSQCRCGGIDCVMTSSASATTMSAVVVSFAAIITWLVV